jgi:hypothetical protein
VVVTGYPLPKRQLAEVGLAVLTLRPRSFARESLRATATLQPPALSELTEHIPERGPFLAVHNHYNAPGYMAWWNVLAISAAIARRRAPDADAEVHWLMTAAWRGREDNWLNRTVEQVSRWTFARAGRVYGFINMPPMPPKPGEEAERARSVLQAVRLARRLARSGGMLGLTPEGQDNPGGFGAFPAGAGEFIALLVEAGLPVLPCGNSQRGDRLRVRFGPAFTPEIPSRRNNRDEAVSEQVRDAIARCLEV